MDSRQDRRQAIWDRKLSWSRAHPTQCAVLKWTMALLTVVFFVLAVADALRGATFDTALRLYITASCAKAFRSCGRMQRGELIPTTWRNAVQ